MAKLCKVAISEARAGQSGCCLTLSVKFLSMADDFYFRLPFAKVEEMEKIFRENWISDADVLSFHDSLERDLKWKNMWTQLKSGKLHTILCSQNM